MNIELIREKRLKAGLSQDGLARKIGVTRQTICIIEKGRYNPSLRVMIGLAKELDSTLDELFGD